MQQTERPWILDHAIAQPNRNRQAASMPPMSLPASMDGFRQLLTDAMAQLLEETAQKQISYRGTEQDVLSLLRKVAALSNGTIWQTWRVWVARHGIPAYELIELGCRGKLSQEDLFVLRARLRDLVGYLVLALLMVEDDLNAASGSTSAVN